MSDYIELDEYHARPDLVREIAQAISAGKLVACPTDTTYGVFANFEDRRAVDRLTRLGSAMAGAGATSSERRNKPMAMIFCDLAQVAEYVVLSGTAFSLVKRLLPGPFTIILPGNRTLSRRLNNQRRHLGVRIPDSNIVLNLLNALGQPVLSITGKNREGELVGDALTLAEQWEHEIDVVVDTGPFLPEPSTVLEVEGSEVVVVREGKGPLDSL